MTRAEELRRDADSKERGAALYARNGITEKATSLRREAANLRQGALLWETAQKKEQPK